MAAKERFVRWQSVLREHFSATTNTILALSTGLLAFQASMLLERKIESPFAVKSAIVGSIALLASIAAGILCSITRLSSFRKTLEVIKTDDLNTKKEARAESACMDDCSWALFWIQLLVFLLGSATLVVVVASQIAAKQ